MSTQLGALPILTLSNISKHFEGTQALSDVSFELRPGEVHALVGENGAGKSTLVKIITGVHQPDGGKIVLDGEEVVFADPLEARRRRISAIYQEPTLFPDLTIAENIFIGNLPTRPPFGRVDWPLAFSESNCWLETLGIHRETRTKVRGMSIADQQMVEIAKALALEAKVLIMDEPTSALTVQEANDLFTIVRRMREAGTGIIFITHRLEEVFQVADRVTVLRDGHYVGTHMIGNVNRDQLINMMVGRTLTNLFPKMDVERGDVVLKVDKLSKIGTYWDISFELHQGEILGLAGLAGAQRSELVKSLFGVSPADSGTISIDGQPVNIRTTQDAMKLGLAYVPADRQQHGLVLPLNLTNNITLPILQELSKMTWVIQKQEEQLALGFAEKMEVRAAGLWQEARQRSGANQQKVVLAKWLATKPHILILHEPTRGIDVKTKAAVHQLMGQLALQGLAILMISSELPEIMGMSDRVIVMSEGRITAEFSRADATQEKIMAAMSHVVGRELV